MVQGTSFLSVLYNTAVLLRGFCGVITDSHHQQLEMLGGE